MTMMSDTQFIDALNNATIKQRQQIAGTVGIPANLVNTRWTDERSIRHMAPWVLREVAGILKVAVPNTEDR